MKLPRRQFLHLAVGAAALPALSRIARAQAYPTRPVRLIVGLAAGGPTDIVARIMGGWLSENLGQQFVVENRTGAGGMIAAGAVINSPPDGYTLLVAGPNHAIGTTLYTNFSFVFHRDTTPVAGLMRTPNVMVVPPPLPVKTVAEFIDYAKANPGKLSYASSGNGTSVHMSAELFKAMTGTNLVHVPYRGSSAAYPDLLTGKVDVMFDNLPGSIEFVKTGKLRALGVTTAMRSDALPDVPSVDETIKGYEASAWYGISGPKGIRPEVVETLNKTIAAALADPKIKTRVAELGAAPMQMTPADFGKFVADETEKWAKVVKVSGAKPD
jgi:tripartite-type tricarboxylate transporter receptor subunit TctC